MNSGSGASSWTAACLECAAQGVLHDRWRCRLAHDPQRASHSANDGRRIASHENHCYAKFIDEALSDLRASRAVSQVDINKRYVGPRGQCESLPSVGCDTNDIEPDFPYCRFKVQGNEEFIFDDQDAFTCSAACPPLCFDIAAHDCPLLLLRNTGYAQLHVGERITAMAMICSAMRRHSSGANGY